MNHLRINITDCKIIAPYTLQIFFNNGQERTINFEPVLYGYYYEPLRNLSVFNQVRVDPEIHTLVWPNDADFDPATLYNWHLGDGTEFEKKIAC